MPGRKKVRPGTAGRKRSMGKKRLNLKPPGAGRKLDKNTAQVQYDQDGNVTSIFLRNENGEIILCPFHHGIFRVYLKGAGKEKACLKRNSWAIDFNAMNQENWIFADAENILQFQCPLVNGSEAELSFDLAQGTISCRLGPDLVLVEPLPPQVSQKWLFIQKNLTQPGQARIFGLGESTVPMDKAGQKIIMWNVSQTKYKMGDTPLYQSWPVVIFQYTDGPACGLVFDNPGYSSFEFSADGKQMRYAVEDLELSYFFLLGPTLPEVMRQLSLLTGKPAPLPKWALGYHQSRWSYAPSSRVREIAREFRKRDIPCDVLYLDIDYMHNYKCFTWGKDFGDYPELIQELHRQGFKIVPILDPGLKVESGYQPYEQGVKNKMFVRDRRGNFLIGRVWPGDCHFPDFVNPFVRQWWGELVREFARSGLDGIWCDMNEPTTFDLRRTFPPGSIHTLPDGTSLPHEKLHNLYGLLMSRATYEGLQATTGLPFVVTRSAYLGGQKYAVTWTGDNTSNWAHFRASIPMLLNLGLSGQPVVGPDIGGYHGEPAPDLYERWILQGALYPYSRTHTSRGTKDQEPWSFGPKVEASARKAIKLRYRLIPYLYSCLFESIELGHPVMRPIFYDTPTRQALKPEFHETEFLLGPYLLAAPLVRRAPIRAFYLPPGKWFSWWCRKECQGDQIYVTVPEEDTDLPLFVRANAVIPVYPEPPSFLPDHSLNSLEFLVVLEDTVRWTAVEYFGVDSLLAYEITFWKREGYIGGSIYLKQRGDIPAGYRPPQTLSLCFNHRIQSATLSPGNKVHLLQSDGADSAWTRLTVQNPVFPLWGNFALSP